MRTVDRASADSGRDAVRRGRSVRAWVPVLLATPRLAPFLAVAVVLIRWLSLTTPIQPTLCPLPRTGPAAPAAVLPDGQECRSRHPWGFGHPTWLAVVGTDGASVHPCDQAPRPLLAGEGPSSPIKRLAAGTILPVHTSRRGLCGLPRWARVDDLHLVDADPSGHARDRTDWMLLAALRKWSPGGVLVALRDLKPATPRDLGAAESRYAQLSEFTRGLATNVQAWQGEAAGGPVVLMLFDAPDPEVPLRELQLVAYQAKPNGSMIWLACRYMLSHPLSNSTVSIWPSIPHPGSVPDILAFVGPLGPVCWRWDGQRYRRALPTTDEVAHLARTSIRGLAGALSLGACLLLLLATGWRLVVPESARRAATWAAFGFVALWAWEPLLAAALGLPMAGLMWAVGVRARARRQWLSVAALVCCPGLFALALLACLSAA